MADMPISGSLPILVAPKRKRVGNEHVHKRKSIDCASAVHLVDDQIRQNKEDASFAALV